MSLVGRLVRAVLPGVRQVHAQVARYAAEWEAANDQARDGVGPLWVVLGDSTAQGIGAPSWEEGYVGQLHRALNEGAERPWRVLNISRSGARAADVLDRQIPILHQLPSRPDLVTCAIGANDVIRRTPPPAFLDQLRRIMAALPDGAIVATLPQGLNPDLTQAANQVIREEAPAAGLLVADVWSRTGPPWHGKFAADRFHPGALGYADWAAAFAEVLPRALPTRFREPKQPPHRLGFPEPC